MSKSELDCWTDGEALSVWSGSRRFSASYSGEQEGPRTSRIDDFSGRSDGAKGESPLEKVSLAFSTP